MLDFGDTIEEGIIPARAGFTWATPNLHSSETDHPRSRGVYELRVLCKPGTTGSSPLARGLRLKTTL